MRGRKLGSKEIGPFLLAGRIDQLRYNFHILPYVGEMDITRRRGTNLASYGKEQMKKVRYTENHVASTIGLRI